jgi:hypothetical protein
MNEPGIADVADLRLVQFPANAATLDTSSPPTGDGAQRLEPGQNAVLAANQIAVYADRDEPPPFEII